MLTQEQMQQFIKNQLSEIDVCNWDSAQPVKDYFASIIIAQDDDNCYSESGYVAVRIGDWCALSRYEHCSCYDTLCDLTGGGIGDALGDGHVRWDWQGTAVELLDMATRIADPAMPIRNADPEDYDYDHLVKVYEKVRAALVGTDLS